ncbi:uncharacterized protein LOC117643568 isoform X2 [Thrips palmi]|uniref:Uncharacterized protein LOC117643568 isoform X2 n=1 Tax=Thrips palmi TaxID=161013 RepID=A0A6P8YW74_THRPL|nr:uncharacterized protein LOC117643568 isoform X2 [Thrips palmi]
MAFLSTSVVACAILAYVLVDAKPCKFDYPYNPTELATLEKRLLTCMKDLPSRPFPNKTTPNLDCARAAVDSLRGSQARSTAGVPAATVACLRLPRYAATLNKDIISKAETCIQNAVKAL